MNSNLIRFSNDKAVVTRIFEYPREKLEILSAPIFEEASRLASTCVDHERKSCISFDKEKPHSFEILSKDLYPRGVEGTSKPLVITSHNTMKKEDSKR